MDDISKIIDPEFVFELSADDKAECDMIVTKKMAERIPLKGDGKFRYELTLTTPDYSIDPLLTAMVKITTSKMFSIYDWTASVELTKEGRPHIHMYIISEKKILPSRIKKLFSNMFHLSLVRNSNQYLAYIEKEKDNLEVINYCLLNKCQQFYKKQDAVRPEEKVCEEENGL